MQRGLEGRRVALFAEPGAEAAEIRKELIAAGAEVSELPGGTSDDRWHSGMYAALVLVGRPGQRTETHPKLAQLVREFMVSEKPVAVFDVDAADLQLDDASVAVRGSGDAREFAQRAAKVFADRMDESAVDEMSDLSFPASDPPAVTPGTAGQVSRDGDARA